AGLTPGTWVRASPCGPDHGPLARAGCLASYALVVATDCSDIAVQVRMEGSDLLYWYRTDQLEAVEQDKLPPVLRARLLSVGASVQLAASYTGPACALGPG
ncbi:hypothetical protein HaLaN_24165, partial [Haematococcus lacustris]